MSSSHPPSNCRGLLPYSSSGGTKTTPTPQEHTTPHGVGCRTKARDCISVSGTAWIIYTFSCALTLALSPSLVRALSRSLLLLLLQAAASYLHLQGPTLVHDNVVVNFLLATAGKTRPTESKRVAAIRALLGNSRACSTFTSRNRPGG